MSMSNVLKKILKPATLYGVNNWTMCRNIFRSYSARDDLTKLELEELTKIFNDTDKNKDGYLSREEFGKAMKKTFENVSNKKIDEIMDEIKVEPNQKASLDQFLDSVAPAMVVKNVIEGVIQVSFDVVDTNSDGKIDREETKEMLKMIGQTPDDNRVDYIMQHYDKDGDGNLTLKEFNDYVWIEITRS